jgi:hypothetical protein
LPYTLSSPERTTSARTERRQNQRIPVQIPMFLRGLDSSGKEFLDLAKTMNISASGALLTSSKRLQANELVNLTIPAPPSESAMLPSNTPPIRARVLRQVSKDGTYLVGVEFLKRLE